MRDPDVVVPPAGSFRRVQGDHPDWKKKNMDPKQVKAWEELIKGQPYVVVQVAELGTEGPGVNERIDEIMAILLRLSQILGIVIIPSHSVKKPTDDDNTPKPRNKEPVWYLILGLTEKWCAALIRAAWLDSQKISLNFDRWTHDIPTLCAAFRFVYRFGAHSKEEYDAIVRRELLESDIRKVIIEILLADIERGGQWRRSTRDDAFGAILDSVDVDVITVNVTAHLSEPVAFIHIAPPTSDWQDWLRFCAVISKHGFGSPATGHPVPFAGRIYCGFCHSLGHTSIRCPVRYTPGWHHPPQHLLPQQAANTTRGGGRGGRGRGTGRGRGARGRGM